MLLALLSLGTALAGDDLSFDLDGYYRVRAYSFSGLYADQESQGAGDLLSKDGRMMTQRLRIQPSVNFQDKAKFFMMSDVMDDVVWGDNESLAATSLFAGDPSTTGMNGHASDTFQIKRAWMEFNVPIGLLRVGRQPSNWGMGLLANDGNGFDDSFGENHYGSTYDRVIFATRPLAVAQGIMGKEDSGLPLFVAVGVDRLVEDPLDQYYGYSCQDNLEEGVDDGYDSRCDEDGNGVTDQDHSYVDDTRTDAQRKADWWVDQGDDVMEMIYVLIFKGEGMQLAGHEGDLIGGVYVVQRKQRETDSNVLIADAYLKLHWQGIYLEGEALHIGGDTNAIAIPGAYDPTGTMDNPLAKTADIWGYVARAGYDVEPYAVIFETGYASGDEYVADADFTGRPLHPDYNVGLLLYEEVLARITATTWTNDAEGLWSKGGVYNSRYIFPTVTVRPHEGTEIIGGYLRAWPDRPDGSRILCNSDDTLHGKKLECSEYKASSKAIGWEADLAVKQRFEEHMLFSLEGGYAHATDRLPTENLGLGDSFWTLQSRIAYEF